MTQNFSLTIIGLLAVILSQVFDAQIANDLAADLVTLVGILVAWYGRWRKGDLTWYGARK